MKKEQKRIKPENASLLASLGCGFFFIGGAWFFYITFFHKPQPIFNHLFLILFAGIGIVFMFRGLLEVWHERVFRRTSTKITGRVIDHRVDNRVDDEGNKFSIYYLVVSFNASGQNVTLTAEVDPRYYKRITQPDNRPTIHYSTQNPRIVLFEGESGYRQFKNRDKKAETKENVKFILLALLAVFLTIFCFFGIFLL